MAHRNRWWLPMNSMVIVQFANCKRLPEGIYHPGIGIELGWIWCLRYVEPLKMWKLERFEAPRTFCLTIEGRIPNSNDLWFSYFNFVGIHVDNGTWSFSAFFSLPSWHSNECILFSLETAGGFSHQASEIRSDCGCHCSAWKNMCWMGLRVHYGSFGGFLWFGVPQIIPNSSVLSYFSTHGDLGIPQKNPKKQRPPAIGFPQRWLDSKQNQQNIRPRGPHLPGLVNVYITMENHHAINGKHSLFLWPFSIAMFDINRG